MIARGQGSGATVVAGVTPSIASAPTDGTARGPRCSMAADREPPTRCTRTASGTSSRHAGPEHQVELVVESEARPTP